MADDNDSPREPDPVAELKKLWDDNEQDASIAYKLALELLTQERFEEALDWAETCAVLAPDYSNALKILGMTRDYCGMTAEAERALVRATQVEPNDADAWLCLGTHWFQPPLRDYREAIKHFTKACAVDPHSSQAHFARAEVLEKLDRTSEARLAYVLAIKANNENLPALRGLASLETREGRLEKAADLLRIYIASRPEDRDAKWTLARVMHKLAESCEPGSDPEIEIESGSDPGFGLEQ